MPHVRQYYYRPVKCPMCQKDLKDEDEWFCSKKCEEEWKKLNGSIKPSSKKVVKGSDTSG